MGSMNIKETKNFLKFCSQTSLVGMLLGHTGLGKSQLIKQIADEDGKDFTAIFGAQIEPNDFIGLYKINADGRTDNCSPSWLPYRHPTKEMIEKGIPRNQGYIFPNGGIIFIDEINRSKEDIKQALYQLLNEKRIHTYQLPYNYTIIAAANPPTLDGINYDTSEFDVALNNRTAMIDFRPEQVETLSYLKAKHGPSPVISWIESQSLRGTDTTQIIDYNGSDGTMCYSPRMVENHIILWNLMSKETEVFKRKALETIMIPEKAAAFLAYEQDLHCITYVDVLKGKADKEKLKELLDTKRLDVLGTVVREMSDFFTTYEIGKSTSEHFKKDDEEKAIKRATDFLVGLPDELIVFFLDVLGNFKTPRCITENEYFKQKIKREKLAANKEAVLKV
jgi:hypothetical protein